MSDSIFDEFSQEDFGFTAVDEVEYVSKTDTLEKQLEATQSSTVRDSEDSRAGEEDNSSSVFFR